MMTEISSLPVETLLEIFIHVDGISIGKCRRVCTRWRDAIDDTDFLWENACSKELKYPSKIAKIKSGNDCKWFHIYKNLIQWSEVTKFELKFRDFYNFSMHDKSHALNINYGVLPLKDRRGIVLYDTSTLKYIPVVVPEKNCKKIANNDHTTVMLLRAGLLVQRTVNFATHMAEGYFKADNFVLSGKELYFFSNRDVFLCDLSLANLESKLILHCDYDIKEIQHNDGLIFLFTDCGKIVTVGKNRSISVKPINCPPEWTKQIKHVQPISDKNFICYSRNLFKIETDKCQHLYLDFPTITCLFFYGDFVLIGTKAGEILLYRLSSQKQATKPIFENLAKLPDGKFAVQMDVCERKSGPIIVVATFFDIVVMEIDFFPQEKETKLVYSPSKLCMYKRLLRLRDRLRVGLPCRKSIA